MELIVTGLNHNTATVELRERFAFSPSESAVLLKKLQAHTIVREALLLSTCNRTELYACLNETGGGGSEFIRNFIIREKKMEVSPQEDIFYTQREIEAVRHLFAVVAGLDSMVVGENQILGQVKTAYHLCCEEKANGIIMNKLFHWAFRVGKRARTETEIGYGAVSVSSVAVELAQKIFKDLSNHSALLIGAGETGSLTARCLCERRIRELYISNRTLKKAEELAGELQAKVVPFEKIDQTLTHVDVVISSTASRAYIITAELMKKIMAQRNHRPLFIIDISVPRNFDPEIDRVHNVFLYSIDDLETIIGKNIEKREAEIVKVRQIIDEESNNYLQWRNTLRVTPIIRDLQKKIDDIRVETLENNKRQFKKEDWKNLDLLTKSMMKRLIRMPLLKIKEYNEDSQFGMMRLDTVREIFQLEDNLENED
jgi:glutamyl-tRNA reductase